MASWNAYLQNEGFEKLKEAKHLTEEVSKNDPEDDPFRSMYKARELLETVKKALKKLTDKNERKSSEELIILWAALELRLGKVKPLSHWHVMSLGAVHGSYLKTVSKCHKNVELDAV